jgi:putative efflux protein, MATE family
MVQLLENYVSGETMGYRDVIAIILPVLVDQFLIIFMSMLNTAMVSSAGVSAVSAVSMVDSLNLFLINVFVAVATGGTVLIAQYKGAGNGRMVRKTAAQTIVAGFLVSFVIAASVILFHNSILTVLFGHAEASVLQNAELYLVGSCLSYPFFAINQAILGTLRGVGDTKAALWLSLILNAINTGLNVLCIVLMKLGVLGLVISLFFARLSATIIGFVYISKYNYQIRFRFSGLFPLERANLKKIMFVGIPFAMEQVFFNGGKLVTQTFIVKIGTLAMAANAIGSSIVSLFQAGPNALGISIVTVVGQAIGRQNLRDARKFVRSFLIMSALMFVVAASITVPLFPLIVRLYSAPDEIIGDIFTLVILSALAQPILWSISFITPSALRAAGDSKYTTITSLTTMWLLRVILGYWLGITLGYGIVGVWVAMFIEWGVRGILFLLRFHGEKWYAHRLIDD